MENKKQSKVQIIDESYYKNSIETYKTEYLKQHQQARNVASDKNYFDQYFINKTVDPKKREIESSQLLYAFFQEFTEKSLLTKKSRFEILVEYSDSKNFEPKETTNLLAEYDALLLVWTYIMEQNYYAINTGEVYCGLYEKWQRESLIGINRDYLITIGIALRGTISNKGLLATTDWGNDKSGLYDYITNRYPKALEISFDKDSFPFPRYFIIDKKSKRLAKGEIMELVKEKEPLIPFSRQKWNSKTIAEDYTVIFLEQRCIVINGEDNFDLFFALQLYLTDLVEIDRFLNYHLEANFGKNSIDYMNFLKKISIKYDTFLNAQYNPFIKDYMEKNTSQVLNIEIEQDGDKEATARRQVLAIKYLFDELNVNNVDKIAIAEFIKFITGKEPNQKTKDGNIYKWVKTPFPKSDRALIEDLRYIRQYFEKLGMIKVVTVINIEINTKE